MIRSCDGGNRERKRRRRREEVTYVIRAHIQSLTHTSAGITGRELAGDDRSKRDKNTLSLSLGREEIMRASERDV